MRGEPFITRKITRGLIRIKWGLLECLYLSNRNSQRDWRQESDYIEAQWLTQQQAASEDFVISTGQFRSVRAFVDLAAQELGMKIRWAGEGPKKRGFDRAGRCVVALDPRYLRPTEVETLLVGAGKTPKKLN